MGNKYFKNVTTIEELKAQYKKLAFKYHPDRGGSVEAMQEINNEYDILKKKVLLTDTENKETSEMMDFYKDIINKIINLDGITIELVGTWLWVSGDTKPYRQLFKDLKFIWNQKRGLWQFNPEKLNPDYKPRRSRGSKRGTEEIKNFYGYEGIKGTYRNKQAEKYEIA